MPKEAQTDLFEADGVTPKVEKPAITEGEIAARVAAAKAEGEAKGLKEAIKAAPKAAEKTVQPEKVWTRAELRAQVNEGKITEDQMDDILDRQLEAKFDRKVTETVESRLSTKTTADTAGAEITRYVEAFPDINKDGTALRDKIQVEFDALVKTGANPSLISTELAAIKIACGPLKTGAGRKPAPDSHEEVGGGDGGGNEKPETEGPFKGLSPAMTKHYKKLIDRGIYKGASDPKLAAEIKLARGRRN